MSAIPLDRFRLDGRIAMVTGASGGLGHHFALVLAQAGARVAVAARGAGKLDSLVAQIVGSGGQARAITMDVTDAQSVRTGLDALADWGRRTLSSTTRASRSPSRCSNNRKGTSTA
jgi:NADP-dependent 3-hydroxy acid dehydrogenase YdfG